MMQNLTDFFYIKKNENFSFFSTKQNSFENKKTLIKRNNYFLNVTFHSKSSNFFQRNFHSLDDFISIKNTKFRTFLLKKIQNAKNICFFLFFETFIFFLKNFQKHSEFFENFFRNLFPYFLCKTSKRIDQKRPKFTCLQIQIVEEKTIERQKKKNFLFSFWNFFFFFFFEMEQNIQKKIDFFYFQKGSNFFQNLFEKFENFRFSFQSISWIYDQQAFRFESPFQEISHWETSPLNSKKENEFFSFVFLVPTKNSLVQSNIFSNKMSFQSFFHLFKIFPLLCFKKKILHSSSFFSGNQNFFRKKKKNKDNFFKTFHFFQNLRIQQEKKKLLFIFQNFFLFFQKNIMDFSHFNVFIQWKEMFQKSFFHMSQSFQKKLFQKTQNIFLWFLLRKYLFHEFNVKGQHTNFILNTDSENPQVDLFSRKAANMGLEREKLALKNKFVLGFIDSVFVLKETIEKRKKIFFLSKNSFFFGQQKTNLWSFFRPFVENFFLLNSSLFCFSEFEKFLQFFQQFFETFTNVQGLIENKFLVNLFQNEKIRISFFSFLFEKTCFFFETIPFQKKTFFRTLFGSLLFFPKKSLVNTLCIKKTFFSKSSFFFSFFVFLISPLSSSVLRNSKLGKQLQKFSRKIFKQKFKKSLFHFLFKKESFFLFFQLQKSFQSLFSEGKMPNRSAIREHLIECKNFLLKSRGKTQIFIMKKLQTKICRWRACYQNSVSKYIFVYCDFLLFLFLWSWAKKRHPNKSKTWIQKKYFHSISEKKWVFGKKTQTMLIYLSPHSDIDLKTQGLTPCF